MKDRMFYFDKDIFFKAIKGEDRRDILEKLFESKYVVEKKDNNRKK